MNHIRLEDYVISETKLKQVVEAIGNKRVPVSSVHHLLFLAKANMIPGDFDDWSTVPSVPYSCDVSAHIRAGLGMNLFLETPDGIRVRDTRAKRERDLALRKFQRKMYFALRHKCHEALLTLEQQCTVMALLAGMVFCVTKGICGPAMLDVIRVGDRKEWWAPARKLLFWLMKKQPMLIPLEAE